MNPASIKAMARNVLMQQACNTTPEPKESLLHGLLHEVAPKNAANDASHSRWLIHFPDCEPQDFVFAPPTTHAEVLDWYRTAVAAEPAPQISLTKETPCQTQHCKHPQGPPSRPMSSWGTVR